MAKINITASNVMASSGAYLELFNRDGLQVYAMKKGRFQIKCGSTHKVVRNTQELQEGIDGLGLHQFPHSGESVVSEINEKLSSTYRLEVRASNDKVVHMIEGSKDKIFGECIGTISVDKNMVPGRRYACNGIFGGDYMILVPMSAGSMCLDDSFSTSGDQMYEKQEFAKGVIVVGQNPLDGSTMTVLVDEVYPNGAFKDSEGIVWAKEDIKVYKFEVGRPTTNEDFKAPSESLYTEEDIPTYNPVGDVEKVAPMIGDLKNYDSILSASAGILSDFMKTAKSVAYIDRSSLNKVKISGINPEGQATDGEIEWNVRICSPHYKRSSNIMIPMVMTEGSIDLGKEFTASTGLKYPMTTEAIKEHLGTLIEGFEKKHRASRYPSTLKADKDIDNLMNGIEVKAEKRVMDIDPEATYTVFVGMYGGTKEHLEETIGNASDYYAITEEEFNEPLPKGAEPTYRGERMVSGEYLKALLSAIEADPNTGDDITVLKNDSDERYDDWKEVRELIGGGKDKLDELMPDVEGSKKVAHSPETLEKAFNEFSKGNLNLKEVQNGVYMPVTDEDRKLLRDIGGENLTGLSDGASDKFTMNYDEFLALAGEKGVGVTVEDKDVEGSAKVAGNYDWVSKDGKIGIINTFHDYTIVYIPTGEHQGMGDGVDMFFKEDEDGTQVALSPDTPEFDAQMAEYVNDPVLIEAYFPDVKEGSKKVAGKKVYRVDQGRGIGKYQVRFYDGVQKHKDGSAFFDLHIVNNKKDLAAFEQKLVSEGYVEQGYDWKDEDYDKTRDETLQEMNLEQQEVNLYTNISEQDIRDRMNRDNGKQGSKKVAGNSGAWMGPLKIFKDYSPEGFAYSVYVNGDYKGIYLGDDPTLVELGGPDWEDNVTEGENAPTASKKTGEYQPKTGEPCSCKPGIQRDNCPACEGTGMKIDFQKIRDSNNPAKKTAEALQSEDPSQNMGDRIKAAFAVSNYASEMETFDSVYEHGHWWISGTNKEGETSQFDAVDAEGQGAIDGFDFEKVASKKADLSPESLAQSIARGDSYALSKVSDSNRDAVKAALQKMGHDLAKVEELMQPVEAAKKTAEVGVDKQYVLTVKHDNGTINIQTSAQSEEGAISKVMKSEGCPRRSIVKVKEAARKTAETGGTIEVGYYWNVNADIDESSAKEDGLDLESDNYKAAADAALQAEFNVEKWLKQNLGAAPNTGSDEYGLGGSLWVAKGSPQHKFVMAGLRDNGEESFSTSSGTMPMDDDVLFAGVEDKFASVLNVDLYFMRMTNQPPENNDYSDEPEGDASAIETVSKTESIKTAAFKYTGDWQADFNDSHPLLPWMVFETVVEKRPDVPNEKVEAVITALTDKFAQVYKNNESWAQKILNGKGNMGRDTLYAFVNHWIDAMVKKGLDNIQPATPDSGGVNPDEIEKVEGSQKVAEQGFIPEPPTGRYYTGTFTDWMNSGKETPFAVANADEIPPSAKDIKTITDASSAEDAIKKRFGSVTVAEKFKGGFEGCVQHFLNKSDFKPKHAGDTKREAAEKLCAYIKNEKASSLSELQASINIYCEDHDIDYPMFAPIPKCLASVVKKADASDDVLNAKTLDQLKAAVEAMGYTVDENLMIKDLGKFESNWIATPYFWEMAMVGDNGEDMLDFGEGETYSYYKLSPEEQTMFKTTEPYFLLSTSSSGFVGGEFVSEERHQEGLVEYEKFETEGGEEGFTASKKAGSQAWDVILDGKIIDTVWDSETDPAEVKRSLVGHDGYDPNIVVQKPKKKASVKTSEVAELDLSAFKENPDDFGVPAAIAQGWNDDEIKVYLEEKMFASEHFPALANKTAGMSKVAWEEPTCPKCGHRNAMLAGDWDREKEAHVLKCRDCGYTTYEQLPRVEGSKTAGGGAGIRFENFEFSGSATLNSKGKTVSSDLAVIKFDAHGYMDGMSDVNGKLLKITDVTLSDIGEYFKDTKATFEVTIPQKNNGDGMLFGGYQRPGGIAEGTTLDLEHVDASVTVYSNDEMQESFESTVSIGLAFVGDDAKYWYDDVFGSNYPDDADVIEWIKDVREANGSPKMFTKNGEDDLDAARVEMQQQAQEDAQVNWGVSAAKKTAAVNPQAKYSVMSTFNGTLDEMKSSLPDVNFDTEEFNVELVENTVQVERIVDGSGLAEYLNKLKAKADKISHILVFDLSEPSGAPMSPDAQQMEFDGWGQIEQGLLN